MSNVSTVMKNSRHLPMDAQGTLSLPFLEEGRLVRGTLEKIGAYVIHNGGTFEYRSSDKRFFSTSYYNVKFSGRKDVLLNVARSLDDLA